MPTDITLHYEIDGPPDGRPVLLVHGILSCHEHWQLNLPALHEAGFRTLAISLYGHGPSPSPEDVDAYRPDSYVEQFSAMRELLGVDRWFVIGQSLGAAVTLHYAMSRPDEVIAHVVTNSHSAFSDHEGVRSPEAAQERAQRMIDGGISAVMEHPLNPRRARAFDDANRARFDDAMLLSTPIGIARTMMYTSPRESLRERLTQNPVETLLIAGDREEAFSPLREWVESHAMNFEVARVDGSHAVNISAADDFNRIAIRFLERFT